MEKQNKIAIITGANSGVGYAVAQRLLELEGDGITIVMACRNHKRAHAAREKLLCQFPFARVNVVLVDVGSVQSVLSFSQSIIDQYTKVDYLFCNAGILSALGIDWYKTFKLFFTHPIDLVERSDATIQAVGEINEDGMGKVFAANVFGHYVMIRELEHLLSASKDGRIIWTSSITADNDSFDIEDWQGIKSNIPYESSKWACDLVAIAMNDQFVQRGRQITSYTTSPGVVATSIGDLPRWITAARTLIHYTFRILGVQSQNITAYNGALADVFAALQPLGALNYMFRYLSLSDRMGNAFVEPQTLDNYDPLVAEKLIQKCEIVYTAHKRNASNEA
ncbi:hypothetical protein CLU79DRAFT_574500 [Phycomyces nitens]|nr:hypothetical protein CLU79DRAFT_574500 [Phycomyces nitens]